MAPMTSLERVLTTLSHKEADRVPFFLPLTMHGAKELGLSIKDYFSRPDYVAEGQIRLQATYKYDFLYTFHYASVETEAWNGDVIYTDDGPPNAGAPFVRTAEDIAALDVPDVYQSGSLLKVLKTTELLKTRVGDSIPLVGVVMSPFSLPVMQMGFDHYIDLIYEQPAAFERLMQVNEEFCVAWANAQFAAGATAIAYFDPVSSSTIIPRELYLRTGFEIARRVFARLSGPVVMLLASGRVLPTIDDLIQTGPAVIGASTLEELADMKAACRGKATVIGNLNAIEMCRWTPEEAEEHVKQAIRNAASGGGFIVCDNHGEIPWQVPHEVLRALSDAVFRWGTYPLTWTTE